MLLFDVRMYICLVPFFSCVQDTGASIAYSTELSFGISRRISIIEVEIMVPMSNCSSAPWSEPGMRVRFLLVPLMGHKEVNPLRNPVGKE